MLRLPPDAMVAVAYAVPDTVVSVRAPAVLMLTLSVSAISRYVAADGLATVSPSTVTPPDPTAMIWDPPTSYLAVSPEFSPLALSRLPMIGMATATTTTTMITMETTALTYPFSWIFLPPFIRPRLRGT